MKSIKLLFILLITSATAQKRLTKAQLDSLPNTIENEFVKIYNKGNNWHEYKMIKRVEFTTFQKNVLDSVSAIKKDVVAKQQTINQQNTNITSLNEKISKLNTDLSTALEKEDSISFLGIPLSKVAYNSLVWIIIAVLLAGLLFFIFKFKNSNLLTKNAKNNLVEIEQEFEEHRKKTIEREQKLRRKLQDEINKQRGV